MKWGVFRVHWIKDELLHVYATKKEAQKKAQALAMQFQGATFTVKKL